ncbi:M16 family metallopeptidase [Alteriqipengyuania sp. 357]
MISFPKTRLACTALLLGCALPALAQQTAESPAATKDAAVPADDGWDPVEWDLEDSDFAPEAGWTFGMLDNGMRYIIRPNDRPEGTVLVRMLIDAGSLDEREDERGYAHYVEHMAFNGSTNVPEGEMVKLLERLGLAFGADTNASTGFESTQYKLDLPRADEELLDTALMLMRETASELTFDEEAVQREKGVILSERRVRNNYALQNTIDQLEFLFPESRLSRRMPIGTIETLEAADSENVRAFWEREYVPADTVLVVVGDFDPQMVERNIVERFADWQAAPSPEQPGAGPVDPARAGKTDIYIDPALTESITLVMNDPYVDRPDTAQERVKGLLRWIGGAAISRRLQRLQRVEDPPFRNVSFNASDFLEAARSITLGVATEDGEWQRGLDTGLDEFRRALIFGFDESEIAEQVTNMRTRLENQAANMETRTNGSFVNDALAIAHGDAVPLSPREELALFEAAVGEVTPAKVLAEMRETFRTFDDPLIRFTGKSAPEGGEQALRSATASALARDLQPPEATATAEFAYTDFGKPGTIVEDTVSDDDLAIRTIRFANNVRLNLKQTDLSEDRVSVRLSIDGGDMLASREAPLAVALTGLVPSGGLGKHSTDELQSILAGRSVGLGLGSNEHSFDSGATTTPRDLELQLQLMAALVTDPGYRAEGLGPWRAGLDDFFARLGRTPDSALAEALGARLSDGDPRFTRQPVEAYRALDFDQLRATISDRLANGAIEIAIVGDFDEQQAIDAVAATFGALPEREAEFRDYDDVSPPTFTDDRRSYEVFHDGEPDQAIVRLVWPTTDNEDWDTTSQLTMLERVTRLMLTDKLREELGQTYSSFVDSRPSSVWDDYGTFAVGASVDVGQVEPAREALLEVIAALRSAPVSDDLMQRARQPVLESLNNRLKSNDGWMGLVGEAQSEPEDIERFLTAHARYEAMTGEELQALAQKYLVPDEAVGFTVLPREQAEGATGGETTAQ